MPKFNAAIESGKAEMINGTRLIYPMESEAMRPLNLVANRFFAYMFSYLVNTRLTDTLCGTKAMLRNGTMKRWDATAHLFRQFRSVRRFRSDLRRRQAELENHRDPDPLQGARTYGETNISRFRDGWLLLKMVWFAYRKLKAV